MEQKKIHKNDKILVNLKQLLKGLLSIRVEKFYKSPKAVSASLFILLLQCRRKLKLMYRFDSYNFFYSFFLFSFAGVKHSRERSVSGENHLSRSRKHWKSINLRNRTENSVCHSCLLFNLSYMSAKKRSGGFIFQIKKSVRKRSAKKMKSVSWYYQWSESVILNYLRMPSTPYDLVEDDQDLRIPMHADQAFHHGITFNAKVSQQQFSFTSTKYYFSYL